MLNIKTQTYVQTRTRIELLQTNIRIALKRAQISDTDVANVIKGIKNRWIRKIAIHGVNTLGQSCCVLELMVDWKEHDRQIQLGNTKIELSARWNDEVALELSVALDTFDEYVHEKKLGIDKRYYYTSEVNEDNELLLRVRKELGFVSAQEIPRKPGFEEAQIPRIRDLPELQLRLGIVPE
ncbi:MAG: hypothetical protein JST51_00640 [Armatimonadetes bacterium]|nr:hypothetical protein [Armatimonadota bacterium]